MKKIFNLFIGYLGSNLVCVFLYIILNALSYRVSKIFSIVLIALIVIKMLINDDINNYYLGLFFLPNIRIFDGLGFTFLINLLLAFPPLLVLIKKKITIKSFPFFSTVILFFIEFTHEILIGNIDNIFPAISSFAGMMFCIYITTYYLEEIKIDECRRFLTYGIFASVIVFAINESQFLFEKILSFNTHSVYRLSAYGGDPNYFVLYLTLAISLFYLKKNIKPINALEIYFLIFCCILTKSKFFFLLLPLIIIYTIVFISIKKVDKTWYIFVLFTIFLFLFFVAIFNKETQMYLNMIVSRFGLDKNINLNRITSERSDILLSYYKILKSNFFVLLFGSGFQYHLFLNGYGGFGAHNTILDLILSWGIVGLIFFSVIMFNWCKRLYNNNNLMANYFSIIILFLNFMNLSCLSATMFFWILSLTLFPITKEE